MRKSDFMPILLALLLMGLCLINLSGCAGMDKDAPDTAQNEPAAPADGPLTEEEIRYFNEEFFNGVDMNIRNQFLSSMYDTPADIDIFQLFYSGTGLDESMEDGERAAYAETGGFVDCDVIKVSAAGADQLLLEHMGLTLAETRQTGLGNFTYLPQFDAYYNGHGDTNYRSEVVISAGERKDGLICLYYDDAFYADGWKCVTLRETEDGGYHFVSNSYCDPADVPDT